MVEVPAFQHIVELKGVREPQPDVPEVADAKRFIGLFDRQFDKLLFDIAVVARRLACVGDKHVDGYRCTWAGQPCGLAAWRREGDVSGREQHGGWMLGRHSAFAHLDDSVNAVTDGSDRIEMTVESNGACDPSIRSQHESRLSPVFSDRASPNGRI